VEQKEKGKKGKNASLSCTKRTAAAFSLVAIAAPAAAHCAWPGDTNACAGN
jgi:hypothetical protein